MSVVQITSEDEFTSAINKPLAVVDFYATWCGPCKKIAPEVQKLAESNPSVAFYKVDVDELEEVAQSQQIQSMPTFKIFSKGEVVRQVIGANIDKIGEALAEVGEAIGITDIKSKVVLDVPKGAVFPIKTAAQFKSLLNHPKVVVFFGATWCGPCKKVTPEITTLAAKFDAIRFAKVDVEEHENIAEGFSVVSLPTFVFFQGGVETARVLGSNLEAITSALDELHLAKSVPTVITAESTANPKSIAASAAASAAAAAPAAVPASAPAPAPVSAPAPAPAAVPMTHARSPAAPRAPVATPTRAVPRTFPVLPADLAARVRATPHTVLFFPSSGRVARGVSDAPPTAEPQSAEAQTAALVQHIADAGHTAVAVVTVGAPSGYAAADVAAIAAEYGITMRNSTDGGDLPAYKLLHRGIHFATVTDGNVAALDRKLRELVLL